MIRKGLFLVAFFLLFSFTKNDTIPPLANEFVVVLDAGHGGHDPGNLGNGYLEKNIALNIVLEVGKILEKEKGVKVIYTRDEDKFVDLFERGEIANKANADLFVSVHCDSHNSDAYGAGTFVLGLHANKQNFEVAKKENSVIYLEDNYEERYAEYDINSPESVIGLTIMQEEFLDQSIQLAKFMQDNFTGSLKRKDRKVKQAGFIVLHQTFMPSVLVETGFLTNKNEGAYLNSKKGQQEMGKAIAEAILQYKNSIDTGTVLEDAPSIAQVEPEVKEQQPMVEKEAVEKAGTNGEEEKSDSAEEALPQKENEVVDTTPKPKIVKKDDVKIAENTGPKSEANITFKVQLMASSKVIPLDGDYFNGLNTLSKEPFNNLFRYMYGETDSYFKAKLLKSNADAKGYTTSYIVAYKDGNRIPLNEALQIVGEQ
ncbi:N-acetylmuramoyl-L-alanine amidase [Allomuricauda sp. d1]|uniref:N-acetylmuramoyl-L-alanine amidase family protein n=1 Tax=Allomuricauda sp. d1 TaxID=3136725 RepID=UPI0031DB46E7